MDGVRRDRERTRPVAKQNRLDALDFVADCRECQSSFASQCNLINKELNTTPVTVLDRGTDGTEKTGIIRGRRGLPLAVSPGQAPLIAHYQ